VKIITRHTSDNVTDSQIIQRSVSTAYFIQFRRKKTGENCEKVRILKDFNLFDSATVVLA